MERGRVSIRLHYGRRMVERVEKGKAQKLLHTKVVDYASRHPPGYRFVELLIMGSRSGTTADYDGPE